MRRLAAVAALFLSACSSASQRQAPSATTCTGDRTVTVDNRSNRDADVVIGRRDGASEFVLGTVMPGRQQEFTLPQEAASYARTRIPPNGVARRGSVDMRYGCRQ